MVANQLYELCEAVGPEPTRSVHIRPSKYYRSSETLFLWHWLFSMAFEVAFTAQVVDLAVVVTITSYKYGSLGLQLLH